MPEDNKKKSTLDKLLLGVIIGGAVGSVVGVAASNKEVRDKVREKIAATSDVVKEAIDDQKKKKDSIWHKLHSLFFKKKK